MEPYAGNIAGPELRGMTSTRTGPLAGAAEVRPDGWLTTPLTTDPAQAARARSLACRHHPDAPGSVRCLTARYRTAAFTLGDPPSLLLKRHGDEAAYLGEILAYRFLDAEHVLPTEPPQHLRRITDPRRWLPRPSDSGGEQEANPGEAGGWILRPAEAAAAGPLPLRPPWSPMVSSAMPSGEAAQGGKGCGVYCPGPLILLQNLRQ